MSRLTLFVVFPFIPGLRFPPRSPQQPLGVFRQAVAPELLCGSVWEPQKATKATLGCPGTEVRINGLLHLLINGVFVGSYHPLILTFDPNFQRDIPAATKARGVFVAVGW